MIMAAATDAVGKQPVDYLIRDCTETEHVDNPNNALRGVDPAGTVMDYMQRLQKKFLDIAEFKPTLLQGPQQGSLEYIVGNDGSMFYAYDPKPGFLGKDKAVFMVEYRGLRFKVSIDIHVLEIVDIHQDTCPRQPTVIRLRKSSQGNRSELLSRGLSAGVRVADLHNASLAQIHATGAHAPIVLLAQADTAVTPITLIDAGGTAPYVLVTRRISLGTTCGRRRVTLR
ncbi:MAG: hypothetical protein LWW81_11185 [Rhodocyclales bacterium]|nr:hypothetical protein [Rhodocyclales bacterium]